MVNLINYFLFLLRIKFPFPSLLLFKYLKLQLSSFQNQKWFEIADYSWPIIFLKSNLGVDWVDSWQVFTTVEHQDLTDSVPDFMLG